MRTILLCTAVGFVIGAVLFANVFSHRAKWERGIFLAFLVNIPNLIFVSSFIGPSYGRDLYAFMLFAAVVLLGIGGFGLGAIVGMIFVSVRRV
jgi:hypothetical protein